jgi:hypothetical protein
MYYSINGYWKDDNTTFEGYIVREFDDTPPDGDVFTDDDIFYYGLSESDIQGVINNPDQDGLEFVITSYEKL